MEQSKVWLSWSTGKDCAHALHRLKANPAYEVIGILSTLTPDSTAVAMHRTPAALLRRQQTELSLPLHTVSAFQFEKQIKDLLNKAREADVKWMAFGDLFLEEVRAARERNMSGTGIGTLFPLWKDPTPELARSMIQSGLKAIIVSVDLKKLPLSFLGREFDLELLADLPAHVDPCGENGEFHTFVYDSPLFRNPIPIERGEVTVEGDYAYLQPLLATTLL